VCLDLLSLTDAAGDTTPSWSQMEANGGCFFLRRKSMEERKLSAHAPCRRNEVSNFYFFYFRSSARKPTVCCSQLSHYSTKTGVAVTSPLLACPQG